MNVSDLTCTCSTYAALNHHLLANAKVLPDAPLFAFEAADGSWAPMKYAWFLERYNEVWTCEGLRSRKGHGFRIGRTTHLLLLGIDPWVVMVQGQWSSQVFLGYWRQCEEILLPFMGFAGPHLYSHDHVQVEAGGSLIQFSVPLLG